jgi:hypothetical protein
MCDWEVPSVGVTAAVYAPTMAKRATVLWDIQRGMSAGRSGRAAAGEI